MESRQRHTASEASLSDAGDDLPGMPGAGNYGCDADADVLVPHGLSVFSRASVETLGR